MKLILKKKNKQIILKQIKQEYIVKNKIQYEEKDQQKKESKNININITNNNFENKNKKNSIKKDLREEYKDMQEYIYMTMNGTLYNPNEIFYKSENPKISIVISVYNGEAYLNTTLLSIQNQDFKDIEIVIVDDCSKDNSVKLIKELMKRDPRIQLYQHEENKGALYTKTNGVLHSKGKYVMTIDEDDIYVQKDAFSTLYEEAEKNNLDVLGFALIGTDIHLFRGQYIHRYIETPILYQPDIPRKMYDYLGNRKVKRTGDTIYNFFIKTEIFIKSIKQINDKYLNEKMNYHDDFLLFFLLTRNAHNFKQIKRIFYIVVHWKNKNNTLISFRMKEKLKNRENLSCLAYLNYIELMLIKTNNTIKDKKIASFELEEWFLNNKCRNNTFIRKKGIDVCNLFLGNEYIENDIKNKINIYLNQIT